MLHSSRAMISKPPTLLAALVARQRLCPTGLVWLLLAGWVALAGFFGGSPTAQAAETATVPPAFNVEAASRAFLDRLPPDKKARSDAYFEGGYWLQLWQFLYGAAIGIFLLQTRLSARMRDLAGRV